MSALIYPRRRIPLSVSLGITTKLNESESLLDEMFSSLSFDKQKALLINTDSLAIVCPGSRHHREKKSDLLVFLAVRRALGLKNHTKLPVVIVVKSQYVGKEVATELARHSTDYKLYNMVFPLKDKINKDLLTKETRKADFILITYPTLRDVVLKKALPATEQIVYINPLTIYNCHEEAITLDNIKGGLYRHKCRKPHFTFILDANLFPVFEKRDYQDLLCIEECLFFSCKEKPFNLYNNKLRNLEHLLDEHYWFFTLRELFRKRNNLTGLVERFKKTLTYKLHLYSNNITPRNLEENKGAILGKDLKELKTEIDKKVKSSINKTLLLFTKKHTKTIIGNEKYGLEHGKVEYSWEDTIETPGFFPFIEKRQDNNYYLTRYGYELLKHSSNYTGAKVNFPSLIRRMATTLFKKKESSPFQMCTLEVSSVLKKNFMKQ